MSMFIRLSDRARDMWRTIKCAFGAHDLVRLRQTDGALEDVCFYCDHRRPVPPRRN